MGLYTAIQPNNGPVSDKKLVEIKYHRGLNSQFVLTALPGYIFFAGFFIFRGNAFQGVLFCLLSLNAVLAYSLGQCLKDLDHLVLLKRIGTGIAFALLAVSMISGILSGNLYISYPWIFLYPVAVLFMFSERPGIFFALVFCLATIVIFLVIDLPVWDDGGIRLFKFNSIFALLVVFVLALIAERSRVHMRNDLLRIHNQAKAAEEQQRRTNAELKSEIIRREQSERALSESESRYRALFEDSAVSLWEENHAGIKAHLDSLPQAALDDLATYLRQHPDILQKWIDAIVIADVNRATLNLLGADDRDEIKVRLESILPVDFPDMMAARICALHRTGAFDGQMEALSLNGQKLHLLMRSTIPAGYARTWQKVFTSAYDITAKVTAEEDLARAERHKQHTRQVQAIASLAGGIAHQFNNALSAIYGNLDLLEIAAGGHASDQRLIDALRSSSHHIGHLTEQLLAYAQGGKYQPREYPIKPLIKDVLHHHSMVQSPSLKVTTCFEGDLILAGSDVTQIKMVLEAVLVNAAEAIDNKGEISIRTLQCEPPDGIDRSEAALPPNKYVLISIEDRGSGMDVETRERLFEPFFTTKFVGRGLGMAAAFGIVRNHDGIIDVTSEPGKGTCVMIYLPCAERPESQPPA